MSARYGPGDGKRRPRQGGGSVDHEANGIDTENTRRVVTVNGNGIDEFAVDVAGFGDLDLSPFHTFMPLGMAAAPASEDVEILVLVYARRKRGA